MLSKKEGDRIMYNNGFAERMKKARLKTGLTQREVAKETGIPQSTIAYIETGKREPDIEKLGTLIDFYGENANYILGTRGENEC